MVATFDLTPLQQSMYASAALTDRPWHYIEQIVVHLPAEQLNEAAMSQAWSELAAQHPALRHVIVTDPSGNPKQSVHPATTIVPALHDWHDLDHTQTDKKLDEFLAADRLMGIDAASFPPFRVNIFHINSGQSKLLWTLPHSLLDGRSFAPLLNDVFERYQQIVNGTQTPIVITDGQNIFKSHCHALSNMSHVAGEDHFANALAGWEGSDGLVDTDTEPTRKIETPLHLTKQQSAALVRLAKSADVPLSSVILMAWGVVLGRFTGHGDVVFGNTRNGRHVVDGASDAAGCFITTVPVRLHLNPNLTIQSVLTQIRAEQIAVRPFEHTPLTSIRRRLDVPPGRQIFDSVLMFDFGTLDHQLKAMGGDWINRNVDLLEEGDSPVSVAV